MPLPRHASKSGPIAVDRLTSQSLPERDTVRIRAAGEAARPGRTFSSKPRVEPTEPLIPPEQVVGRLIESRGIAIQDGLLPTERIVASLQERHLIRTALVVLPAILGDLRRAGVTGCVGRVFSRL